MKQETSLESVLAIGQGTFYLTTRIAAGLTAIDTIYVARKRISPIYLLDAVTEIALIAAWIWTGRREHA